MATMFLGNTSTGFSRLTHQTLPTVWLAVCIQASPVIALQKSPNHVVQSKMPSVWTVMMLPQQLLMQSLISRDHQCVTPAFPHANVQLTRHADHNPWPWHVPNLATCPKQSYPLQLLKPHKSTATKAYLPLQHSQHLQRQPVPYPGAYSVHLAQHWPIQVHAQSVARTLITAQANAPTYGSMMVNSSAITN